MTTNTAKSAYISKEAKGPRLSNHMAPQSLSTTSLLPLVTRIFLGAQHTSARIISSKARRSLLLMPWLDQQHAPAVPYRVWLHTAVNYKQSWDSTWMDSLNKKFQSSFLGRKCLTSKMDTVNFRLHLPQGSWCFYLQLQES